MTEFDYHKALWMWEFSQQAEKSLGAALVSGKQIAGVDTLLVKCMDGLAWMGDIPNTGGGPRSVDDLQQGQTLAESLGMRLIPWVNVIGADPKREAAAHAALGPVLMCDVEPYDGFMHPHEANLLPYLAALRANGVQEIHLAIDPRPSAVAAFPASLEAIAAAIDGWHPQIYWTDWELPAATAFPYVEQLLGTGVPVYPILPGTAATRDINAVWSQCYRHCLGVSAWRLGSMDGTQLVTFSLLEVQADVIPLPPAPPLDLAARVAALESEVSRLNGVLTARFALVCAALDPANPPAEGGANA